MSDEQKKPDAAPATAAPNVNPPAAKQPEKKLLDVPEDENQLPGKPWSVNPNCKNNLIDRYGPDGAEEMYRRVALKYGHFDPRSERNYRPDLAEGEQDGERVEGK